MAEALYRKYRPQVFGDVVGQEHIETTLKNAIEQNKVSHAYLFCGPRGTGKTTTARLLAKALLCSRGHDGPTPDPDGTCEDCRMIAAGEHPDVYELDAASRTGVENVREEIIGRVQFAPTRGRCKVYIIDEVHMLSSAAFNALLKTLEEPPDHVVFILATTDPQKVPETIHSRCQRFDFHRIGTDAMVARLGAVCTAEGVEFEGEALELVAHRAEGGMRNALTALEQLIAYGGGTVTLEVAERMLGGISSSDLATIMRAIGERDAAACFRWVAAYVETGADLAQFARDMAAHVRNLYVMSIAGADVALEVGETERAQLVSELPLFGPDRASRLLCVLGDVLAELKTSTNPRLSFEIALTRMVRPDSDLTLAALAERVEALERRGSSGSVRSDERPGTADAAAAHDAPPCGSNPSSRLSGSVRSDERPETADAAAAHGAPSCGSNPSSRPEGRFLGVSPQSGAPCAASLTGVDLGGVAQPAAARPAAARPASAQPAGAAAPSAPSQPAASAAAASAGAVSAELAESFQNPAALQRMWQAALAALKRNKAAYGVLFLNTKAVFDQATATLRIEFPAENAFAFKASQKPEVQEAVAAALRQAAGAALPFSYTQRASGVAGASAAPAAARARAAAASAPAPAAQRAASGSAPSAPSRPAAPAAATRPGQGATPPAAFAQRRTREPMPWEDDPRPAHSAPGAPVPPAASGVPAPMAAPAGIEAPEPEVVPLDAYDSMPYGGPDPSDYAGADSPRSHQPEEPIASQGAPAAAAPAPPSFDAGSFVGSFSPSGSPSPAAPSASTPASSASGTPAPGSPAPSVPEPSASRSATAGLPAEPPVDARSSASIDASGPTILEQKDALMAAFGDGVVFDTVD